MKIKRAMFFYNTSLLNDICSDKANYVRIEHYFTDTLAIGDAVKFIGETTSALVEVISIETKDCNGYCKLYVRLLKKVQGELKIEY